MPAGDLADRDADLPGRGRGHADGQLRRHPHRRLPGEPTGHGHGRQPGGGLQRRLHRPGPGRRPGPDQLAAHLPRLGARRAGRHRLGLSEPAGAQRAPPGPHRLAGQHHLRPRPGPGHGGHHLRHRALRRRHHGLGQSAGADRALLGAALLVVFGVVETRVAQPMFRLQLFKIRAFTAGVLASFLAALEPGRADVHAHHLAAGHLAAPARLQLRRHPVVGRRGHAAPHRRAPGGRPRLGHPVGPFRRPPVRHRRA